MQGASSIDISGVFRRQQLQGTFAQADAVGALQAPPRTTTLYSRYVAPTQPVPVTASIAIQARSQRVAQQVDEPVKRQCFHQSISPAYPLFQTGQAATEDNYDDDCCGEEAQVAIACSRSSSNASSGTVGFLDCCEVLEDEVCKPVTCRREAAAFELLAEVSIYSDHTSPKTLAVANNLMSKLKIPGAAAPAVCLRASVCYDEVVPVPL